MKSLVEQLRAGAELKEAYDSDGIIRIGYQPSLRWRASAEIERLRAVVKMLLSGPPERLRVNGRPETLDWFERLMAAAREALGDDDRS